MLPRSLVVSAALLAALLVATAIPAPFTVDENNYLVSVLGLRAGRLSVPGTEDLPPSVELLFFDPAARARQVTSTPVVANLPPLYAPVALPFSLLGWRGLVALNALAYVATACLAFVWVRRSTSRPEAPWLAALAVLGGSYFVEYAQALWPHMLSMALVTGGVLLAARALEDGRGVWAAGAGFLVAVAAGVRYQNAFVLGCIGLGLLLLARYRVRAVAALALGAALPFAASATMNHARLGFWNPISKQEHYLPKTPRMTATSTSPKSASPKTAPAAPSQSSSDAAWIEATEAATRPARTDALPVRRTVSVANGIETRATTVAIRTARRFLADAATMAWARVVDYTARPSLAGTIHESYLTPHPGSGAYVIVTAVKKAWLQSSPWLIVSFLVLAVAWLPELVFVRIAGAEAPQRQLRLISLVVFLTLAMFAASGVRRTDGGCFNQRYFCELVPLMAVALAWAVPIARARRTALLAGGLAGTALAAASLWPAPSEPLRHWMVMYVPLALAGGLGLCWIGAAGGRGAAWKSAVVPILGASLGWALAIHLGDDVRASRLVRRARHDYLVAARPHVPERSAMFASAGERDSLGPLLLERDLVIADPRFDDWATTRRLLDALHAQGRRVFFVPNALPPAGELDVLSGIQQRRVGAPGEPPVAFEVRPAGAAGS